MTPAGIRRVCRSLFELSSDATISSESVTCVHSSNRMREMLPTKARGDSETLRENTPEFKFVKGLKKPALSVPRARRINVRRLFRAALISLFILQLGYLSIGNLYLNSRSLHLFVNRSPEHFYMDWAQARTWLPGVIQLEGVSLSGRSFKDLWYCSLRECSFVVDPLPLLWRRVDCSRFSAAGVDFRLRQEELPGEGRARVGHPPIPPLLAPEPPDTGARARQSWRIRVDDIQLGEVDQIWIGGLRVRGPGQIQGALRLVTQGEFEAQLHTWAVPRGEVAISGAIVSSNAVIRLGGKLGPLVFAESRGDKLYGHLDARLELQGDLIDIGQLGGRVDPSAAIRLGGTGRLDASVQVVGGQYWPGSRLEIHSPQLVITTGNYSWRGSASLIDRIEMGEDQKPRARLELEETQLELWYRDRKVEGATGPRLTLESVARGLRLVDRFADADLRLKISPMQFQDASVLNAQLPQPLSKVFQSGNLTAVLELQRTPDQRILGRLGIEGQELAVILAAKEYSVDARFSASFAAEAGSLGRLQLSETSLHLTNIITPRLATRYLAPWSADVELYRGELKVDEPWRLQGGVRMSMHDTRPILAALRSLPGTPSWLRWIPTMKDLNGQFQLGASEQSISLNQLAFVGRGTDIRAELEVMSEKVLGLLYVRFGLIALGLELMEGDRDWHLLGAKHWYEKRTQPADH